MKHSPIDRYSDLGSPIHRMDVRIKGGILIALLIFLTLSTLSAPLYAITFIFTLAILFISKIPPLFIFKRVLIILPFILFLFIFIPFVEGEMAVDLILTSLKSILSIHLLILFTATTPFHSFMELLKKIRLPSPLRMGISLIYRYFFILSDEIQRMALSAGSRSYGSGRIKTYRTLAGIIGTLLIRSFEKGERVFYAMLSRGFEGEL